MYCYCFAKGSSCQAAFWIFLFTPIVLSCCRLWPEKLPYVVGNSYCSVTIMIKVLSTGNTECSLVPESAMSSSYHIRLREFWGLCRKNVIAGRQREEQ